MASDGVEGQSRGILRLSENLTVRNESQFDQCLESVADTKGKSVSLIQQFGNSFFDLRILECGCKEFC